MDGGFRAPRPAERRVVSRPEPTHRQHEEHRPASEPPKPAYAASRVELKEKKPFFKRFLWPLITVVIVVAAAIGWFVWSSMTGGGTGIDSSKYQAVFFTNGQVYFGKLQAASGGYMKLTDIFYLQSKQSSGNGESGNPQETSTDQNNNVQLIKLGDEIHGPEDEMILSKDQVLFYENLKSDGKVSQSIQKFKDSNK